MGMGRVHVTIGMGMVLYHVCQNSYRSTRILHVAWYFYVLRVQKNWV